MAPDEPGEETRHETEVSGGHATILPWVGRETARIHAVPTPEVAMALDERPELLTITEAAQLLRISRTTAYAEAKRFERTGEGLPVIRVGRSLRAPRAMLQRLIAGELSWAGKQ